MSSKDYRLPIDRVREDRIVSTYSRAVVAAKEATRVLSKPLPHSAYDRGVLASAAESLTAYLAELER